MLKSLIFLSFLGILLLLEFSCKKELQPQFAGSLVINGLFSDDSTFRVSISHSISMDDTTLLQSNYVKNASVVLYEDNTLLGQLTYHPEYEKEIYGASMYSSSANYFLDNFVPKPGKSYKLKAIANDLPSAESVTFIPTPVKVKIADTLWYPEMHFVWDTLDCNKISDGYTSRLGINIEFTDSGNGDHYYLLEMDMKTVAHYTDKIETSFAVNINFDSENPLYEVNCHHGSLNFGKAFSNKSFSGKKVRLKVSPAWDLTSIPFYPPLGVLIKHVDTYYVKLYSITRDYFQYVKTLDQYNQNLQSPFYPPVLVHSNINGGLGIFAGAAVSRDSVLNEVKKWIHCN